MSTLRCSHVPCKRLHTRLYQTETGWFCMAHLLEYEAEQKKKAEWQQQLAEAEQQRHAIKKKGARTHG